jgi:hypothetical protein
MQQVVEELPLYALPLEPEASPRSQWRNRIATGGLLALTGVEILSVPTADHRLLYAGMMGAALEAAVLTGGLIKRRATSISAMVE